MDELTITNDMNPTQYSIETGATMAAKAAPPVTVSLATVFGVPVNELLLWATLIYTVLMITHKLYAITHDVLERRRLKEFRAQYGERRVGLPDMRECPVERRERTCPAPE